jgi:hypothetical protein
MLGTVTAELKGTGIQILAVEARSSVRDRLRSEGVDEHVGGINRFTSVADALENFDDGSAEIVKPTQIH